MGNLTFMLWGPFNPEFFHCTDYVMLLQLPHIFGTCLDWCSEFSCTLRVESHFTNTHFYVCSFYIPYANQCGPTASTQVRSGMLPSGPLPLLKSRQRRAFWFLRWSCLLLCLWVCVVLREWRRGCSEKHLLLHVNAGLASEPAATNGTVTHKGVLKPRALLYSAWWEEPLNSDLFNLEMLSPLRHWEAAFYFSETEMLPSHC